MREFKFRIWDKEKGEWFLTKLPFSLFGECVLLGGLFSEINSSKLDNYVIQQFTGLLDKNGKEIYEGDIIEGLCLSNGPSRAVVGFDTFGIFYTDIKKYWSDSYENCLSMTQEYNEVIGNIFENPELLVDKKEEKV